MRETRENCQGNTTTILDISAAFGDNRLRRPGVQLPLLASSLLDPGSPLSVPPRARFRVPLRFAAGDADGDGLSDLLIRDLMYSSADLGAGGVFLAEDGAAHPEGAAFVASASEAFDGPLTVELG